MTGSFGNGFVMYRQKTFWLTRHLRRVVLMAACAVSGAGMSFSAPLQAAPASSASVQMQDMTWTELRDAVASGTTTILVPIGGTEQSGPYIALGKHNARAEVLARRIAEKLGHALVAPVIAYVPEGSTAPPTSHMRFPGTITVPDDVFEKLLESAASSFRVHGFTNVFFLGDHGGYQKDLVRVAARLNKAWGTGRALAWVPASYYEASSKGFDEILRSRGFRANEIGTHAGLADASLQLAVAPGMVRTDALRASGGAHQGSTDGVYGGDAQRASAELGQLGVDLIVERTVAEIRQDLRTDR